MSNKHLPRLFAQALNDKRVELFDEFIHPEYNNHNAYVEPADRSSDGEKAGGTMNYLIWTVSLIGILSTAVVCGTDMFF